MNETVTKLVDIVFRDTERTDEVQVLYEQVLLDCQDRYTDLVSNGMDEDEAIAAVVESLKGMEDVLRDYPSRVQKEDPDEAGTEKETVSCSLDLPSGAVQTVSVFMETHDIRVMSSRDEQIHLHADSDCIRFHQDGNTVYAEETQEDRGNGVTWFISLFARMRTDLVPLYIEIPTGVLLDYQLRTGSGDIIWDGVGAKSLSMTSGSGDVSIEGGACRLQKVKMTSASGDLYLKGNAEIQELICRTASGDISGHMSCGCMEARSASGDIELEGQGGEFRADTLSGDLELDGIWDNVWCKTMSGDVEVDADAAQMTLTSTSGSMMVSGKVRELCAETVSGDIQMELYDGSRLDVLHAETRSGDVRVHLPQPGCYSVKMTTRSGDAVSKVPEPSGGEKAAEVSVKTVSGDIIVR